MPENWLLIETSGRVGKVGLAVDGVVRSVELDATRRNARDLTATVEALLKEASLAVRDLTGVMASRGPGSYTGLRVGLMSAKALAYAVGCELRAVDTFAAIAEQAPPEATKLWVIADALQGQVYAQPFTRVDGGWNAGELRIEAVTEWLPRCEAGAWVSGPGVKVYDDRIPRDCPRVSESDRDAHLESMFAVGSRQPPLTREELFRLEPLYLRGSSAEEKAKRG
jgi:tRNA threonylcarbamoyladenosine biosynthesis protein TsaB